VKLIRRSDADTALEPPAPGTASPEPPVPGSGSRNHPAPRPAWVKVIDGGPGLEPEPGTGRELKPGTGPEPELGTGTGGSAESPFGPVLVLAARAVLAAGRSIAAVLLRLAEKPGHPLNRAWTYEPRSLAAHHAHAKKHGRADELQLHVIGKMLVLAGNGLHALGWSARGQKAALAVLVFTGAAIGFLVL
jgi:hypothetical protein